ncbi:MAG: FtsX-like permease family protein [Burkholderiales bacterium]
MSQQPGWALRALSVPEWRLHPWRHAAVALAVAVGVALAFSVHLINASALSEFAGAVRAANGEPDLTIAARTREGFDDALIESLLRDETVRVASPVVELDVAARAAAGAEAVSLRVLGIDALQVAGVAPALLPRVDAAQDRLAVLDPDAVFANAAALRRLDARVGDAIELRGPAGWQRLRIAGTLAVGGPALLVLDIAAAQARLGMPGRLSRIDLRLMPGIAAERWLRGRQWPDDVRVAAADEAEQRLSNLSRAYRVNLSVLALVALLVGAFLVYSVLALSVAQRTPTFALLGVLGLTARQRRAWVLAEASCVGAVGSALGLLAGAGMAWLALRALGGDLGGGYFPGAAPRLQIDVWTPWLYGALGTVAAIGGAWWPARAAGQLAPAQALKGLSSLGPARSRLLPAMALLASAAVLALLPPWRGLPLAAYASVAALLAGGVALVPATVQALLARPIATSHPLLLLAWHRARHQRHTASAAVAGVVASVALSVALLVMVGSFRDAVSSWLDSVLPADLYLRTVGGAAAGDANTLPSAFAGQAASIPGVARVRTSRVRALPLDPQRPPVALIVRPVDRAANALPWIGDVLPAGDADVFVSEPAAALQGWHVGDAIALPLPDGPQRLRVAGIWRDYARQFGALVIDPSLWRLHGGDDRLNEAAVWLQPGADASIVTQRLRALAGPDVPVDTASAGELRALSLTIFDRSFAVTRYLQVVAIAVGLVGVAASLSAQVLARRKEFGLLVHLGLTRAQVLAIVCGEAAAWLAAGALLGVAIGIAVSVVLVHVVNPQSFHWTMPLHVPWLRVAMLGVTVLVLGVATAALAARHAASRSAVLAVKEDW